MALCIGKVMGIRRGEWKQKEPGPSGHKSKNDSLQKIGHVDDIDILWDLSYLPLKSSV